MDKKQLLRLLPWGRSKGEVIGEGLSCAELIDLLEDLMSDNKYKASENSAKLARVQRQAILIKRVELLDDKN